MELFQLFGKISLNDEASKGLDGVDAKAEKTGGMFGKLGKAVGVGALAIGAAAVGAGVGMFALASKVGDTADAILDLNSITGMSTDSVQEWRKVAEVAGIGTDSMTNASMKLTKSLDLMSTGTGKGAESLGKLGLSFKEIEGMSADERMNVLTESLAGVKDKTERARIGTDLFGGSWKEIAPAVDLGAEAMQNAKDSANIISEEDLKKANDFRIKVADMKDQLGFFATKIAVAVMPMLNGLLDWVSGKMPLIQSISETVFGALSYAVEFASEKIGIAFDFIKQLYESFMSVFYQTGEVPDLLAKIGISPEIAAVVQEIFQRVIDAFGILKENVMLIIGGIKEFISTTLATIRAYWETNGTQMLENARVVFQSIWGAVESAFILIKGIIEQVIGYVVPFIQEKLGLILAFWQENGTQIMQAVTNVFNFIKTVIEVVMPIVTNIIRTAWNIISSVITAAIGIIMGTVKVLVSALTGDFQGMKEGLSRIWNSLWTGIKSVFGTIIEAIKSVLSVAFNWMKDTASRIVENMKNAIREKFQAMKTTISDKMTEIKEKVTGVWDEIMSFLGGIDLMQIGTDIVQGLIDGVKNMAGSLLSAVTSLVNENIPGPIKKILKIQSPSKLMHEMGEFTGEGLEDGLTDSTEGINKASSRMARAMIPNSNFMNNDVISGYLPNRKNTQTADKAQQVKSENQPIIIQSILDGQIIAESIHNTSQLLFGASSKSNDFFNGVRD